MSKSQRWSWALVISLLGLVLSPTKEAQASTFDVNPVRISLPTPASTEMLTVRNNSAEDLRFEVTAFAWDQNVKGEMLISATADIVFFPAMLAVKPGESRKIRVGSLSPAGATEKSYRLFVEELPPLANSSTNTIRMRTRFGIPIFVAPAAKAIAVPRVDKLAVSDGVLSFALKNDGTMHFLTHVVRILAANADGVELARQELPAWYLLAGGTRDYRWKLPAAACGAARLVVSIESDAAPVESTLSAPAASCTP